MRSSCPQCFVDGSLRAGRAARSLIAAQVIGARPATVRGRIDAVADSDPGYLPGETGEVVAPADGTALRAWCDVLASPDLAKRGGLTPNGGWARHLGGG